MIRGVVILVLAFGLGLAMGALFGGGFFHALIAQTLCLWLALPTLVALGLTVVDRLRSRERVRLMSGFTLACTACVLSVLGFTGGGKAIFKYREAEVRRYVDETLPLLDAHKAEFGSYPRDLAEVTRHGLPYYLRGRGRYTSDGETFSFYYEDPNSIMAGQMLTDSHRRWSIAD